MKHVSICVCLFFLSIAILAGANSEDTGWPTEIQEGLVLEPPVWADAPSNWVAARSEDSHGGDHHSDVGGHEDAHDSGHHLPRDTGVFEGWLSNDWARLDHVDPFMLHTEDAHVPEVGVMEMEFGYDHTRAHSGWDNRWHEHSSPLEEETLYDFRLFYVFKEDWELKIGLGYAELLEKHEDEHHEEPHPEDPHHEEKAILKQHGYGPERGSGLTDLEVGLKYRFVNDKANGLEVAYVPTLHIPTGRETSHDRLGPGHSYWALDQRLAFTKYAGRAIANLDIGYELPIGDRSYHRGTFDTNFGVGYHLRPWLRPEVELNYEHEFLDDRSDDDLLAVTYGVVMPISPRWRVDLGFNQAIAGRNTHDRTTALLFVTHYY